MTMMMTQLKPKKTKRQRGVILSNQGLEKFLEAKTNAEYEENKGNRYTLEALSTRTGYSVDTLMKMMACESGVDRQTLKGCFKAFNLNLEVTDYYHPLAQLEIEESSSVEREPTLPNGEVSLKSAFYVERASIESDCYKAILQPGALIRLKAPRRRGKTSLLRRILHQGSQEGCYPVFVSFRLTDKVRFQNLDKFLQWFCANVSLELQIPNRIADYWDDLFGSIMSCKIYFEQYLLAKIDGPVILGLDDVDILFQYPDLADNFFGLLRVWHEEAKNRDVWKKLRLVVVHSSQVYIPLNVNQSPFNVGLPIELPAFTPQEIEELAQCYELDLSREEINQLMLLVGGQPYLVQIALYYLWRGDIDSTQLFDFSLISANSIYGDYLKHQLCNLKQRNPELVEAFAQVVMAKEAIDLDLIQASQLESLGLIRFQGNQVVPSSELYSQYFRDYFNYSGNHSGNHSGNGRINDNCLLF